MSGPAKSGAVIYAADVGSLTEFYAQTLGMKVVRELPEMSIIESNDGQLIIHKSPVEYEIGTHPVERHSAIKLFFTVQDIEKAMDSIQHLGGQVKPEVWKGPNFLVRNAVDSEGNMFHVRWAKP